MGLKIHSWTPEKIWSCLITHLLQSSVNLMAVWFLWHYLIQKLIWHIKQNQNGLCPTATAADLSSGISLLISSQYSTVGCLLLVPHLPFPPVWTPSLCPCEQSWRHLFSPFLSLSLRSHFPFRHPSLFINHWLLLFPHPRTILKHVLIRSSN